MKSESGFSFAIASQPLQIIIHSNIISVCFAKNIQKVDSTYSYFRRQCARSQCLKWLRCKVISIIQLDKTISSYRIVVSFVIKAQHKIMPKHDGSKLFRHILCMLYEYSWRWTPSVSASFVFNFLKSILGMEI